MNAARWRLLAAASLFTLWITYLGSLALANRHAITLSHAQLLVSTLDVAADLEAGPDRLPLATVHVTAVSFPEAERDARAGTSLVVNNLRECQKDWTGPGQYILPLVADGPDRFRVVAVPPSPGYGGGPARIYPARPDTLAQLRLIPKPAPLAVQP